MSTPEKSELIELLSSVIEKVHNESDMNDIIVTIEYLLENLDQMDNFLYENNYTFDKYTILSDFITSLDTYTLIKLLDDMMIYLTADENEKLLSEDNLIDYKNMNNAELIKLFSKIVKIVNGYTDDKSCEADAAIEDMREYLYPGYSSRYN
jgi:hypothetical protein